MAIEEDIRGDTIEFIQKFQDRAWDALTHHKNQIHKLSFWGAGLVVTMLVATKILGATDASEAPKLIRIIYSTETVLVLSGIFYGLFAFMVHHYLSGRFYSTMLKYSNEIYLNLLPAQFSSFKNVMSPYYLYQTHLVKKKKFWILSYHASGFGSIGVIIYTILILILFHHLIYERLILASCGSFDCTIPSSVAFTISLVLLVAMLIITMTLYEGARRKANRRLKNEFSKLSVKVEVISRTLEDDQTNDGG